MQAAIARGLAYAPYADMLWCETSEPNVEEARQFAEAIHAKVPGKLLAYNCSPSFHWKKKLDDATIARFQQELGAMGYKFQFVTLAGFHALNLGMFELAREYAGSGMSAYASLQEREFEVSRDHGYSAVRHQRFVGTGYFDQVQQVIAGGHSSTAARSVGSKVTLRLSSASRTTANGWAMPAPIRQHASTTGWASRWPSMGVGITYLPLLVLNCSLRRPTILSCPSGSMRARSPVRKNPSGVKHACVLSGFL